MCFSTMNAYWFLTPPVTAYDWPTNFTATLYAIVTKTFNSAGIICQVRIAVFFPDLRHFLLLTKSSQTFFPNTALMQKYLF